MGDCKCSSDDMLECILQDPNSKPRVMTLEYLKRITDNFSNERLLGKGGFGQVYKGELQNGKMIAVKKFIKQPNPNVQEMQFMNEVVPLMSLRHPNIVRCVGYCFETSKEVVTYDGTFVLAESRQEMLLCLEYLTMGSLDKYLKDESFELDWHTCYKIIKGVCCGLHYLHEQCRPQNNNAFIIHLDLKPANILLDENMEPKVADFGLSKLFYDKKTQTYHGGGTPGYMAPEYISKGKMSTKADIYSLGVVIIEIITGCRPDPDIDPDIEQIINKRRKTSAEALSLVDCQQIRSCLEIGKCCIKSNRNERPTTEEIIEKLSLESIDCSLNSEGSLCKETKKSCGTPSENQEEKFIMQIKEHMQKLCEKSKQVRDKIELAKGNGMVATSKIKTWLARADTILSEGMAVCESKKIGLNWAALLCKIQECLNGQPSDIAQPPSVLHIDVHAVLLPSQVFFVEQAHQHIIEDKEGMIGIWGPVGVGKTLLLKTINNSFETGNSLIPSSSNGRDPPFDFVIYMTALEDSSVQSIQSEIIQRLKMQDRGDSLTTQATRISKFLQDKSFLVLLDGLQYSLNLEAVGLPSLGNQGHLKRKVVITTRSRSLCDQMRVNRAISVRGLKMNEALRLFQECISNDSLYSEPCIGALAKDLVEQLRALPSELIRIGSAMRGKGEPGQWQNIVSVAKELMHIKDQEASSLAEGIIITKLKQCLQNLCGRRNDVNHEIELGKRTGKVATNQINNWLANVDTNISVAMLICESEQNELNWDLSVIAVGMLRRLQECLGGQPSIVTMEALPPSVQEMPGSSTEQQTSRVKIFDEAMEYIKESSVGVIGIWGLGGVGKTHLLIKINNAFLGDSLFDHVIFVTASKEGSVEKIQGEIGKRLKLNLPEGGDVKYQANIILDILKTRKFLILLDDIWNQIDLEAVGIPYPLGRSKVVLTTRSKTVCGQMDVRKEINVACLPDDEAWQLFQDKVGQETLSSSPRIEALAKELVGELKGLPLALITVGRAMYNKSNLKQWESALHYMKLSCCADDDQDLHMEKTVFKRLVFSYDSLRNDTLRQCLLTCSLWPEDRGILTGDLIRCWIGLGLVDECDIHGSYRKAHSLIGELIAACLLDSCDTNADKLGYIDNRRFFNHQELPIEVGVKMHDVVRDMAIWISCGCSDNKDKWVVHAGVGANLSIHAIPWSRAECISLMYSEIEKLPPFIGSTNLKRLYLHRCGLDERIFGAIQSFTELTYLDLSENGIMKISEELFALVNLEHLDLSCNKKLRTIPKRLRKLTKLKFLYLAGTGIKWIPMEVISCLSELQVIDLMTTSDYTRTYNKKKGVPSAVGSRTERGLGKGIATSTIPAQICGGWGSNPGPTGNQWKDTTTAPGPPFTRTYMYTGIQKLCTLTKLKAVDFVIEGDHGYKSLRKAAGIPIRDVFISRLQTDKLCLAVDTLTGDIAGRTLNELHVESCAMEQIILGDELGKPFDALSVLVLRSLRCLVNIIAWKGTSPLQAWFPRLSHLYVSSCSKLQHLSWAAYLPCLEFLRVEECRAMKQICMGAGQESSKTFPCLKYMTLAENYELASLCDSDVTFPCLELLKISQCPKLKQICMSAGQESSNTFPCLKEMRISRCPRLTHLYVSYCSKLQYLSVDGCLAMKQVFIGTGQESSKTFLCLKYLYLTENDEVAMLCGSDVTFPCLESLIVSECAKLKWLPFTMQSLPHKLTKLDIYPSDNWNKLEWEDEDVKSFLQRVRVA